MNSEIAVNTIGQILMAGRDNTPLGFDAEKDFLAFHESMQYFHLAWLREEIRAICQKHGGIIKYNINEYLLAIRKLSRHDKKMYKLWWHASRRAYKELVIHTIPEIHITIDGTRRKPHIVISDGHSIIVYDSSKNDDVFCPREIIKLFTDFDSKLKNRSTDIIISGLKDLVPDCLKGYFLRGIFTKDMGNSCHYDCSYSIGHEIRLKIDNVHDMAYAYIPDYFWQESNRKHTFENVVYSYWTLTEVSARLPKDVEFICQHRDDCGVSLTDEQVSISTEEFFRRKAILMAYKDHNIQKDLKEQDYLGIMAYCGLNSRFSLKDFVNMCEADISRLQDHRYNINRQLGTHADEITIVFCTDSVCLFFMKNRESKWGRECFIRFPYNTNLSFLKDIQFYQSKAKELESVFEKSWDIETTVGLLKTVASCCD